MTAFQVKVSLSNLHCLYTTASSNFPRSLNENCNDTEPFRPVLSSLAAVTSCRTQLRACCLLPELKIRPFSRARSRMTWLPNSLRSQRPHLPLVCCALMSQHSCAMRLHRFMTILTGQSNNAPPRTYRSEPKHLSRNLEILNGFEKHRHVKNG